MESDFQQQQQLQLQHYHLRDHHPKQTNSGLTRYQSAPSSYFSSFGDRESLEEFLHRPTSPETERILSRFLQTRDDSCNLDSFLHQSFSRQNSSNSLLEKKQLEIKTEQQTKFPQSFKGNYDETETIFPKPSDSVSVPQSLIQNQRQLRDDRSGNRTAGSSLARHNSSPAGLISSIDIESAYATAIRSMGDNVSTGDKEASALTPRSRPPPSPSKLMTPISETDTKPSFSPGLPPRTLSGGLNRSSVIDSSLLDTITRGDRTLSGGLNLSKTKQDIGSANRPPLAHHHSLPNEMEKLLSDSVRCKIRAKRGCATHPRSIAERVRRTKISERMKKLQDLVPNMDKQTNTADMLDLAVDYIKDLQRQVTALAESRARCTCSSKWPG